MSLAFGLATGLATLLGGALALRLTSGIGLLVGFGAGAVLGVSLFDLLPEALRLGAPTASPLSITAALACGFAAYLVIDRTVSAAARGGGWRGHLAAAALTAHSLMDGLGIGLAFHVSTAAGVIVALAVLAHDVLDGANTVTLALAGGMSRPAARLWLIADALAPLVGVSLAAFFAVTPSSLPPVLAVFAGCFLYIGAVELLPQSTRRGPGPWAAAATLAGLALIYLVVRLSGG
jgi:ZIP family zinc transporter